MFEVHVFELWNLVAECSLLEIWASLQNLAPKQQCLTQKYSTPSEYVDARRGVNASTHRHVNASACGCFLVSMRGRVDASTCRFIDAGTTSISQSVEASICQSVEAPTCRCLDASACRRTRRRRHHAMGSEGAGRPGQGERRGRRGRLGAAENAGDVWAGGHSRPSSLPVRARAWRCARSTIGIKLFGDGTLSRHVPCHKIALGRARAGCPPSSVRWDEPRAGPRAGH